MLTDNFVLELSAGRYFGPFPSLEDLPADLRPFRKAPLGVVPKKHTDPPKFRTIQHLSFPEGASVNDGIGPEYARVSYQGIDHLLAQLTRLGPSTYFWKADISEAFRTLPVHRSDWGMQGLYWLGLFFIDVCIPFGLRSAPFLFCSLMDLFAWICVTQYGITYLLHYIDDFVSAGPPAEAAQSFASFQEAAAFFGIPLKPSKLVPPSPSIEYVGFLVDAPSMSVALPDDKRSRICSTVAAWLAAPSVSRSYSEASSLLGYLMHVVQVLPDGKIFCDHLNRFVSGWKLPSLARHHVSHALVADLEWWHDILGAWCGRVIFSQPEWVDPHFYTDALGGLGAGGLLGDRWWCVPWADEFRGVAKDGIDIFWKEMFAIWASLALWGHSFAGRRIILHCDNQSCVAAVASGCAAGHPRVNELLRRIVILRLELGFELAVRYIPSADNPADRLSRFVDLPPSSLQELLPSSIVSPFSFVLGSTASSRNQRRQLVAGRSIVFSLPGDHSGQPCRGLPAL